MGEVRVGQFYVYRDEDGDAVAVAQMSEGPNGGHVGVDYARLPVPRGKTTREDINNRAEFMVAALNSFGGHRTALADKEAEIAILREALNLEAIEAHRENAIVLRDEALKQASMDWAVSLSHMIGFLSDLRDAVKEQADV